MKLIQVYCTTDYTGIVFEAGRCVELIQNHFQCWDLILAVFSFLGLSPEIEGMRWEERYSSILLSFSTRYKCGQLHALAALPPGKNPGNH